jgi:membrane protein
MHIAYGFQGVGNRFRTYLSFSKINANSMEVLKSLYRIFIQSAKDFSSDNAMKFSASLSYYTTFSIAPMLIIIIGVAGIFFGRDAVQGEVYSQFAGLIGPGAADFLQTAIGNMEITGKSWLATIIGIVTLLIGATGVFTELQDSLNIIWSLKAKPRNGIIQFLLNRVISFSMVLTLGFMLIVSLLINTVISLLSDRFFSMYEEWAWITQILNISVIVAIVTALFAFMFKFLPDAKIAWRHVWVGALFTSSLFLLGKFAIGYYLSTSSIGTSFGAAGSLAILLAWVYYSSAILFFGAEFTKNYSAAKGHKIVANDYATFVVKKEKELAQSSDVKKVQEIKHKAQ